MDFGKKHVFLFNPPFSWLDTELCKIITHGWNLAVTRRNDSTTVLIPILVGTKFQYHLFIRSGWIRSALGIFPILFWNDQKNPASSWCDCLEDRRPLHATEHGHESSAKLTVPWTCQWRPQRYPLAKGNTSTTALP